ncbi:hypothetical protein U9330_14535, partial [Escherichia coli]|nr:hypothetical protein [Escherichia coli]
ILAFDNHTNGPLTDLRGKARIFSHPVYLSLKEFSLQDSRGDSPAPLNAISVICSLTPGLCVFS